MGKKSKSIPFSHEYVLECFHYDPDTGDLIWKHRPIHHFKNESAYKRCHTLFTDKPAGNIHRVGKRVRKDVQLGGVIVLYHRLVWYWMTGEQPPEEIDHVDQDPLNNKWDNLRDGSNGINAKNQSRQHTNTSGHSGVSWSNREQRWKARVSYNGKRRSVGSYKEFDDAVQAVKSEWEKLGYSDTHGINVSPCYTKYGGLNAKDS